MIVQTVGHLVLIKVMWKTMLFWGCGAIRVSTEFWWKEIAFWNENQEKSTVRLKRGKIKKSKRQSYRLFCFVGLMVFVKKLLIFGKMEHWLAGKLEWKRLMSKVSLQVSKKLVGDNLVHLQYEMLIKRLILHENLRV